MKAAKKEKKPFQLPHLLFLLLGLLVIMSIMTYILPAGQFVENAAGVREYVRVERTPVSLAKALLYIYNGVADSGWLIALLLISGGCVSVVLKTNALNNVIDVCLYKLKDKGSAVLLPIVFFLMAMLGGFAGNDSLVAVVPIGVLIAKRLRLDPIVGAGVAFLGTMVGFATSPLNAFVPQSLMGIPIYSGFNVRLLNLLACAGIGAVYLVIYAKRVEKNPTKSAMGNLAWQAELDNAGDLAEKTLDIRDLIITALFIGQFPVIVYLSSTAGLDVAATPAVMIPVAIVCGFIKRMKISEIGQTFETGVCDMGFICLIIGMAGAISLVMKNGMILDTIAYYASLPLQNFSTGFAAVGISMVITVLNFFIPSANAKAATLIPIVQPMAENLGVGPQIAALAFQIGDGFCNVISPFLGWTMGALAVAKVPYQKWVKWVFPLLVILLVFEWVLLVVLNNIGWTGY